MPTSFATHFATDLVLKGMNSPCHDFDLVMSVQSFRRYTKVADQAAAAAFYETIQK